MTAYQQNLELKERLARRGITVTADQAGILRKAEQTLSKWGAQECGDGNNYASWAIERDATTGIPYRCVYPHQGKPTRTRIPDRERGALDRVAKLCETLGIHFYHQTDPRGCSLYVDAQPIHSNVYTRAVACCVP